MHPIKKGMTAQEIETVSASSLDFVPVKQEELPVPRLSYGLERVLFNPGVYQLQDPRSRVFNFDPYLQTIMPVNQFDFTLLKRFITSSRDQALLSVAKAQNKKYIGSTSSTTSALSHFHYLLSQWRPVNTGLLSKNFPIQFNSFTALQRAPTAIFLRYRDGCYAIDSDKEYDTANVLSMLGQSMEKLAYAKQVQYEGTRDRGYEAVASVSVGHVVVPTTICPGWYFGIGRQEILGTARLLDGFFICTLPQRRPTQRNGSLFFLSLSSVGIEAMALSRSVSMCPVITGACE